MVIVMVLDATLGAMHPAVELIPIVVIVAAGAGVWRRRQERTVPDDAELTTAYCPAVGLARRSVRTPGEGWPLQERSAPYDTPFAPASRTPEIEAAEAGPVPRPSRAVARALGAPRLLDVSGRRVTGMRETAMELLVYLVVHRDGVASESIARDVYAGVSAQRAAERLATDLANLRGRLREAAGVGREVNPVPRARGRYRLVPDLVGVDWWEVLDDWRLVKSAADALEAEPPLRRLCHAFTDGVLAEGAGYDWLSDVQEQSRQLGVAAHVRLADLVIPEDPGDAASLLDRACELDPFDEALARWAMTVLLAAGDSDAAAVRLARLREALAEIDEEPEAATMELVAHLG